ncbi:MAG: sigma 54-interacting transcriptional regulator [Pseudomonadota bacterium]
MSKCPKPYTEKKKGRTSGTEPLGTRAERPSEPPSPETGPDRDGEEAGRNCGNQHGTRDVTGDGDLDVISGNALRAMQDAIAERTVALMRTAEQLRLEEARRIRAEAELSETERRYRFLFEEAPIAISEEDRSECKCYIDGLRASGVTDFRKYFRENPDEVLKVLCMTTVVSLNRETRRLLGIVGCEDMTEHYARIVGGQGKEMMYERAVLTAEAALKGITIDHSELIWDTPEGKKGAGIASFKVLPGYEATWDRLWLSVVDVTDLRRAQEALNESETRFRSIFEAAEDAIFIKNNDHKYTHVNPAMLRLLGMTEKDFIGKTYEEVFEPRPSVSLKQLEERVLSGESIETEETISTPSGPITLNVLRFRIMSNSGEVMGMCGIARDVTPRRAFYVKSRRDHDFYPSQAIRRVSAQLRSAAENDTTILFLGESGTGKDYLARLLHDKSLRAGGPFMAINCAALSPQLVESELFGHEAGAFTGAVRRKRGLLELAEGGTIFLNEIAELSLPLQAKLLTFLDTRSFSRVGGERNLTVNARIVSATNKDLKTEVVGGRFRNDLYFRLSVFPIMVPPLRERLEDLDLLVQHIIEDLMNRMTILEPPSISPAALDKLRRYSWPGNIRELRNVLERALIMSDKKRIGSRDVKIVPDGEPAVSVGDTLTTPLVLDAGGPLQETLRTVEKTLIQKALQHCVGNVTRAAEKMGLTREQLKYRMRLLGIARKGKPSPRG